LRETFDVWIVMLVILNGQQFPMEHCYVLVVQEVIANLVFRYVCKYACLVCNHINMCIAVSLHSEVGE